MSEQEKHEKFLELLEENEYHNPPVCLKVQYDIINDNEMSKVFKDVLGSFITSINRFDMLERCTKIGTYEACTQHIDKIVKMYKVHCNIVVTDREYTIINRLVFMTVADWEIREEIEYTKRFYENNYHLNKNRPVAKPKQEFKQLKQMTLF